MNEMKDIDFEQELYKHFGQVKDFTLGMQIGKYFYELGKQEKPTTAEGLEEEYQQFCKDFPFPWSSQYINREYIDELCLGIARHFAQWGAEHRGSSETPNDLEEAARKEYPCDKSWMTPDMLDLNAHKQVAFRKGAEWQKEQDTRDMYMSDNRHFEKVYQLGRTDMREQMLKEAVEGCVTMYANKTYPTLIGIRERIGNTGDKVKLIIVKED